MMSEKPVQIKACKGKTLKKLQKTGNLNCIVHYDKNKTDTKVRELTEKGITSIQSAIKIRQSSTIVEERLNEICESVPEVIDTKIHGKHQWCFKNFTNTVRISRKRKVELEDDYELPSTSGAKVRRRSSTLFPDLCVFCDKKVQYNSRFSLKNKSCEKLTTCVTEIAETSIQEAAQKKNDEKVLCKIRDQDLRARELKYHSSCEKAYTRDLSLNRRKAHTSDLNEYKDEQQAHQNAFDKLCGYVTESIIVNCNVERMSMLKEIYLKYLKEEPQFYNPNYKTYKLKNKLINKFGSTISFWMPNYKSELVYSAHVATGNAIELAFEYASSEGKRLEEAALLLRRIIKDCKDKSEQMPWPPTTEYLSSGYIIPPEIELFLSHLVTGKAPDKNSSKNSTVVNSLSQDMCHAVTNGNWKMPKHILLGMTLRHLTGSAEIITLVNHFGHCLSYSQILEIETAICNSISTSPSILPSTIHPEKIMFLHTSAGTILISMKKLLQALEQLIRHMELSSRRSAMPLSLWSVQTNRYQNVKADQ